MPAPMRPGHTSSARGTDLASDRMRTGEASVPGAEAMMLFGEDRTQERP